MCSYLAAVKTDFTKTNFLFNGLNVIFEKEDFEILIDFNKCSEIS